MIRENVPLAPFTSWRVGGPARYLAEPTSVEELEQSLIWARERELPCFVMGKGSNLLVADEGFPGLVIRMGDKFSTVTVEAEHVRALAGCSTLSLVKTAGSSGRGGLGFLSTIPGTIGGCVYMNAGAHGASVAEVLTRAWVLLNGKVHEVPADQMGFSYRHSRLHDEGGVVVEAEFRTLAASADAVQNEVSALAKWRRERQPQALSAGSVFTNPPESAAGHLIETAGGKGLRRGGAEVSTKHANFIVNAGGATASDINGLIGEVQCLVYAAHGLWLHPEVRGVGLSVGERPRVHP